MTDDQTPTAEPEATGYDGDHGHQDGDDFEPADIDQTFEAHGLSADDVPDDPDGYELAATGDPAIDAQLQAAIDRGDTKLEWFADRAARLGLTQKQFNALAAEYTQIALSTGPDYQQQVQQLGPRGRERVSAVETWAASALPKDVQAWLADQPITAPMVKLLEAAADLSGQPLTLGEGAVNDAHAAQVQKNELKRLMQSPEYRRGDPGVVARVRAGFRNLSGAQARGKTT